MSTNGILSASYRPSSPWYWIRWALLIPVEVVAFFSIGLTDFALLEALGSWRLSASGFVAAFVVVSLAYVIAPNYRMTMATAALLIGAVIALLMLSPPTRVTYEPGPEGLSYAPIALTYLGGIIGWFTCFGWSLRRTLEAGRAELSCS